MNVTVIFSLPYRLDSLGGRVSDSDLYRHLTGTVAQFNPEDHILALLTEALHDPHVFRLLLQDFSLDQATFFGRYGCTQETFLNITENLLAKEPTGSRNPMWSVLLVFGRSIEYSSRYARGDEEPTTAEVDYLQRLLVDAADFAEVINSIYHFEELAPGVTPSPEHSMSLDWQTLDVHRLGTTSLIFSIYGVGVDSRKFALKLSHVLFTTVGPIATSTSSYFHEWRHVSRTCPFTPRIIASGTGWILEEFIEGPTLREFAQANLQSIDPLGLTLSVFPPILEALESFHSANHGLGHGDLNPANIIIQKRAAAPAEISARDSRYEYVAYLIDMGRNLLASDTIGRVRSVDTAFVAPEVRRMPPDQGVVDRSADFFSLGHILAFCLGYDRTDGFYYVDERLFRDQPMLARLVCGLINNNPSARVRYVNGLRDAKRGPAADELGVLNEYSSALIQILKEVTDQSPTNPHSGLRVLVQGLFGMWHDVGIAVNQLFRTWRRRSTLPKFEMAGSVRIAVSAFVYLFGATVFGYAGLLLAHRDPIGIGSIYYGLGYRRHDFLFNLELLIIGGSFLIASLQYSVVAYGGISFLRTSAPRAVRVASEIFLWLTTVIVLPCVFFAMFVNPELWILVAACGQTVASLNNFLALAARASIDKQLLAKSHELKWYGSSVIVRQQFDVLRFWAPTFLSYTAFLFALAILASFGQLHDFLVFGIAISFLNIVVMGYAEAAQQGPILRANLSQYAIAGENFRLASKLEI